MTVRFYRRIELAQLELAEAEGWRAVVELDGAVGADPVSHGTIVGVTIMRDAPPRGDERGTRAVVDE